MSYCGQALIGLASEHRKLALAMELRLKTRPHLSPKTAGLFANMCREKAIFRSTDVCRVERYEFRGEALNFPVLFPALTRACCASREPEFEYPC